MICPFQWKEETFKNPFSNIPPVTTRRFRDCIGGRCPAYIKSEIAKIGDLEAYIPEACGMFRYRERGCYDGKENHG